jgi:hypothetical protein
MTKKDRRQSKESQLKKIRCTWTNTYLYRRIYEEILHQKGGYNYFMQWSILLYCWVIKLQFKNLYLFISWGVFTIAEATATCTYGVNWVFKYMDCFIHRGVSSCIGYFNQFLQKIFSSQNVLCFVHEVIHVIAQASVTCFSDSIQHFFFLKPTFLTLRVM